MYHEQLVKHNNLNTKMNLHNDDDNVNDGDIHVIIIMLAYNLHAHIMAVLGNTHRCIHKHRINILKHIYIKLLHKTEAFQDKWDVPAMMDEEECGGSSCSHPEGEMW